MHLLLWREGCPNVHKSSFLLVERILLCCTYESCSVIKAEGLVCALQNQISSPLQDGELVSTTLMHQACYSLF